MDQPDPPPNHHAPKPEEPGMRVRLTKGGHWVDLGVSHSEILVGLMDTMARVCVKTGVSPHPDLVYALDNLDVHRPKGGA